MMEEFGRGLVAEPYLSCAVLAGQLVNAAGNTAQREALLPAMIAGDLLLAVAYSEPHAAGAADWVETKAARVNGRWRLTGRKSLVLNGPTADKLIIAARSGGAADDRDGVTLFIVDPGAPGLKRQDYRLTDRTHVSDFVLDGVEIGDDAVLGQAGAGLAPLELAIDHAIVAVSAEAVGAMDHALWMTRDYLKTRTAFGTTLSTFQALRHRMADMLVELEQARSIVYRGLAALREEDPARRRHGVAATKIHIGQSGQFIGGQVIQLHGGIGMTEEYSIGHYFKRLMVIESLFGNSDLHVRRYGERLLDIA